MNKFIAMRLVIDLDLDLLQNDQGAEAGRILRYWAGALLQMDLTNGGEQPLMDSNYRTVGSLRLVEAPGVSPRFADRQNRPPPRQHPSAIRRQGSFSGHPGEFGQSGRSGWVTWQRRDIRSRLDPRASH